MSGLSDTHPEAAAVLLAVYRRMPLGQKWLQLGQMYDDARALHAAGVRLRDPAATTEQIHWAWMEINLGFKDRQAIRPTASRGPMQNLRDVREVIRVLDALGIPYAVGGSVASSLHGIDRYTRDADLTVEAFPGKVSQFAAAFSPDWYVSEPMIQDAFYRISSFNLINTATGFKVDFFVCNDQPFEQSAMTRRSSVLLPDDSTQPIQVYSPEDVILFKLRWYRLGNHAADQQLKDVLGVLQVQAGKMDEAYLDRWAADLGVGDLLERARRESQA